MQYLKRRVEIGFNTLIVCFSTFMLGLVSGSTGVFLSLRKRSLLSDVIAHASLPGLCIAYILGYYFFGSGKIFSFLLLGASVSGLLSAICIQSVLSHTRLKEDVALASILSVFFGFGILLLGIIQNMGTGEEGGLNHFIYGQTAAMGKSDAVILFFTTLFILSIILLCLKELKIICFSEEFANSIGINTKFFDALLMILSSIVIVVGLHAVGMLLIVALLVIPPAASKFLSFNVTSMLFWSSCIGSLSGLFGSILSAKFPNIPTGGVIVLVAGSFFIISLLLGPNKGLITQVRKS